MLLFTIKFAHSLIIIYMMICLYVIWQYALLGWMQPFTKWAFASVLLEALVFVAYGWECPLTIWALQLGDETGADLLSDLLYLEGVIFTTNFALFCVLGTGLSFRRWWRTQRA